MLASLGKKLTIFFGRFGFRAGISGANDGLCSSMAPRRRLGVRCDGRRLPRRGGVAECGACCILGSPSSEEVTLEGSVELELVLESESDEVILLRWSDFKLPLSMSEAVILATCTERNSIQFSSSDTVCCFSQVDFFEIEDDH